MSQAPTHPDSPIPANRAARRAAGQRGRKLAALGSGAVLATGMASVGLAAVSSTAGAATTITVQNTNDAGAGSLRQALADANAGDTIDLTGVSGTITLSTGELQIDDAVTITGPGASTLSINGNNASRVFNMNEDLAGGTVTISGVTVTGGNANTGNDQGGGILFYCDGGEGTGSLVVDNVVITGNTDQSLGGGLYFDRCGGDANLTITNSVVSNNTAVDDGGGGIWFDEGNTLTIQNSTVSGNQSGGSAGGLYFDDGVSLVVLNSTFSGNTAADGSGGGMQITSPTGPVLIANSTISGNSASGSGGGISLSSGSLTLEQATISGNTATDAGDGLYLGYSSNEVPLAHEAGRQGADAAGPSAQAVGTVAITGTIISANADGSDDVAADPEASVTATIASSVIGTVNDVTVTDGGGNQNGVTNPGLAALANNGGATQTMALVPGSVAIDTGPNPVPDFPGNEFDQRGAGFPRVVGAKVDVGAFEVQAPATPEPIAIAPKFTG